MTAKTPKEILASSSKGSFMIHYADHDEMNVVIAGSQAEVDECIKRDGTKALKAGRSVTWPDGTKEWRRVQTDWNAETHDYIWHEDGDRVRCTTYVCQRDRDGNFTQVAGRKSWRLYDTLDD